MTSTRAFPYYGGKEIMKPIIIQTLPARFGKWIETHVGGGVFFWIPFDPRRQIIISDTEKRIIHLYQEMKYHPDELASKIESLLYHEGLVKEYRKVTKTWPDSIDDITKAVSFWYTIITSQYSDWKTGGFRKDVHKKFNRSVSRFLGYRDAFREHCKKLENCTILERDANSIIKTYSQEKDAVFYIDPPYIKDNGQVDQGPYAGFTSQDFIELLESIEKIKGKFLLSCYPGEIIESYIKKNGWLSSSHRFTNGTLGDGGFKKRQKIELLVRNYEPESHQRKLF